MDGAHPEAVEARVSPERLREKRKKRKKGRINGFDCNFSI